VEIEAERAVTTKEDGVADNLPKLLLLMLRLKQPTKRGSHRLILVPRGLSPLPLPLLLAPNRPRLPPHL
jgi:hypothetical protein